MVDTATVFAVGQRMPMVEAALPAVFAELASPLMLGGY